MPEATSLDNLPRINQRHKVEADDVYLWFDSIVVLNHGANHSIFNFPVVQVDADSRLTSCGIQWLKPTRLDHSFSLTLRFCAESHCSPERSDAFEAGQIRWPHRIEVGFGQRRILLIESFDVW